jgi:hypothetical protein
VFGPYLKRLWRDLGSTDDIALGAMMNRVIGIGALLFHLHRHSELLDALLKPVRDLNRYSTENAFSFSRNGQGRIVVLDLLPTIICQVQSWVGGNGSSVYQALADVMRDLCEQKGIPVRSISVNALSGVFENLDSLTDKPRMRAHQYAATLEKTLRYKKLLPAMDAGLAGPVDRDGPVHEITCLIDGSNMHGKDLGDPQEAAAIAAEFMRMTLLDGAFGREFHSGLQNKFRYLIEDNWGVSFGLITIRVFIEPLIAWLALRTGRMAIALHLLHQWPEERLRPWVQQQVATLANHSLLQERQNWFRTGVQGRLRRTEFKPPQNRSRQEYPRLFENFKHNSKRDQKAEMEKRRAEIADRLFSQIVAQVVGVVNSAGVPQAVAVLEQGIIPELSELKQSGQRLQSRQQQLLAHHRQAEEERRQKPAWKSFSFKPGTRYVQTKQTELDLDTDVAVSENQTWVFTEVASRTQKLLEGLKSWIVTLETRAERLQLQEDELADQQRHPPKVVIDLLTEADRLELFKRYGARVVQLLAQTFKFEWLDQELVWSYAADTPGSDGRQLAVLSDEGMQRYQQAAASFWDFLREGLSCESLLRQKGEDPQGLVERLFDLAVPWINLDLTFQEQPVIDMLLLGSAKGAQGFFSGVEKRNMTLVRTDDPYRIEVLWTVMGFNPLTSLANSKTLKADYLKLRAQGEPLHAYPELIEMIDQELGLYTQDDPRNAVMELLSMILTFLGLALAGGWILSKWLVTILWHWGSYLMYGYAEVPMLSFEEFRWLRLNDEEKNKEVD